MGDFPIGFGRYQLVERLALGGMAELFLATSPGEHGFQKKVVIKRLLPHLVADPTYNAMFIDEAKLTARLVHPKIAQTFELGKVDEALYIAMEHVDGIDVLALLREFAAKHRRVEPQLAGWIAHEVLDAPDHAHHLAGDDGRPLGIVHRDISPSNVLLSVRGDIKLVDFGIASQVDPDRTHKSKSGTLKGKYGYMSPEQVIEHGLDARSDLFSVGVVLAELLTGRRLFAAANELDVLLMVRDAKLTRFEKYGTEIEPNLADIVRKALRKSVDDRWQSAAAFRDALVEWLFDHRHRVTNRQIADVVQELHGAVIERRIRANALDAAAGPESAPAGRAPSDDAAPHPIVDDHASMPIISVSYELETTRRPTPANELASRAETEPLDVPHPSPQPRSGTERGLGPGVIEVPLGDTISTAVGAALTLGASEDSAMRAFDDLPEEPLRRGSLPATPPALSDIAEPADDVGEFSTTSPLRVLYRLVTARATGLLVVTIGGIKKELYVRDGQPEYVSSNLASELFGNYLVSKAVLSDGELAMALAMMPRYGGKLGDTLVGLGLLKPLEVFRHLTRQVRTKIIDVCTWNKGSFGWYAGRENTREAFPLDFNAFEILGAGAMALSDDYVEGWLAKHGALRLRSVRTSGSTRRVGPDRFEVKGLVELSDLLDGKRKISDLVQGDRQDRLRVGRMLCLLESCALARPA